VLPLQITAYQITFRNVYVLLSLLFHLPIINFSCCLYSSLIMTRMIKYFTVKSVSAEDADFSQNCVLLLPIILIEMCSFRNTQETCDYIHIHYISYVYVHLYMYLDSFEFTFTLHTYRNLRKWVFCVTDTSSVRNGQFFVKFRTWFHSWFVS